MNELEVDNVNAAAFFMAKEVVNEYHSFPVVPPIGDNNMFIQINDKWYKAEFTEVISPITIDRLNGLVP